MKRFFITLLAALLFLGGCGAFAYHRFGYLLDQDPPELTLQHTPPGIGVQPTSFRLVLSDPVSGLDEIVVRVEQRGHMREFLRRDLQGKRSGTEEIILNGKESGFEEGKISFYVRAFDRSLLSNAAEVTFETRVDFRKPRLEALSVMHNVRIGGSELAFYRTADDVGVAKSGVVVGEDFFPGVPASAIDPAFTDKQVYAALFAIELQKYDQKANIHLIAEDQAGNHTERSINYRVLGRAPHKARVVAEECYPQFAQTSWDGAIRKGVSTGKLERAWQSTLGLPGGAIRSSFGDFITPTTNKIDVAPPFLQTGYDIRYNKGGITVLSPGAGTVVSVTPIEGHQTVIIDHGAGLTTILSDLTSISVALGQAIERGQPVGSPTPLAKGARAYLEVRVRGVPVDAHEWWEQGWFNAHIVGKIDDVKRALGVAELQKENSGAGE